MLPIPGTMRCMSNRQRPLDPQPDPYSVEGQIRLFGMFAQGLRRRSRRRHQAFMFLGCWLLFTAMIVAILIVVF
jgi:hypothetical protein